ncbi:laminin subunit alpha-1 isoform X3 [Gouania willdenowi]|uniref:laminin subunit alpha-1 isoform X3 n=1 Tax=Gouania willdenowi TaxID=441366 RepID=UPI0010565E70|nr:laminin subunit alpha-1 isoform X3 [Gouania willdenowi]
MKLLLFVLLLEQVAAQQRGLFPAILNLASSSVIVSNATCGEPGPEVYCKLVEHVPGTRIRNPHCPRCHGNSLLDKERHPITNAIDGTNQWWQSPSIKNGRQFHWITITLDLKQVFQVAYIIIKAANSPRPGNWILERSLDGVTFDPWQFYAISDSECLSRYNIPPRLGPPTYRTDTEVICTSYYSRLNPLEHGEIHTSLINGRPGADDLTSDLLTFTSARYIRLRLQRIRTLNADLMTLSADDPIVTRRYYYSIKDISVGGMCICYGHAQSCPLDPVTKKLQCICEHNTCGESCNECCPGYHQLPWQPGTLSEGNTCEKCNCHNKAELCFYNHTVAQLSLSLDTHGLHRGGGVCIHCLHNTAGINCETCRDGHYRPSQVSPYSQHPCVKCICDLRGSESSVCARDDSQSGVSAGQCVCLEGFAGLRCDACAFGFRDFPQCVPCECNLAGSTNTDPCTPCICKENVMGAHCDLCKAGFYNLQEKNPLGCTECFCFGVSDVCESSTWFSTQVFLDSVWLRPLQPLHAFFIDNNLPELSNTSSSAHKQLLQWEAPKSFHGNKLGSFGGFLNFSVIYDIPLDNEDHSLSVLCDIIIEGNGRAVRLSPPSPLQLSPLVGPTVAMEIVPHDDITRDDLLLVLQEVTSLKVRVQLNGSADGPIRLRSVSLDVADPETVSGSQMVTVETCECPWGYSGTSCEACLADFYRVGGVLFGGNCMQCECNEHAYQCDINGVCEGCVHNTTGPHCDQCLPGFYGDTTEGTSSDCQLCPCPLTEASNRFSPTCQLDVDGQVSCDHCENGYTGRSCERCASGYYGNPQLVGGACVRCQCNGNVDFSEPGHCDTVTGECLRCRGNTAGRHCEWCQPGYYGDAVKAKNCQECGCDVMGAVSSVCDVTSGQCVCRENVIGRSCDRCQLGHFSLQSGRGCQLCGCSQSGALSKSCSEDGRCQCEVGVAGDKCDHCSRGYYSLHGNNCTACTCDHTGGNCDAHTGECVCPAYSEGLTCDRCESGYWGHDVITGCKPCSCSSSGSSAPQCDLTNGQCPCREGFTGRSCDRCSAGYYGYPSCTACGCDVAGTDKSYCNTTLGVCDCTHTGQCVCKAAVVGRRCEECVSGFFSLSMENPEGCSPCFCSGVSSECEEQEGLRRVPMELARPPARLSLVTLSDLSDVVSGVHLQGGDILLDTRQLNSSLLIGPLYWRLPAVFEGDQLLSYGGLLSYVVTFHAEDGDGLSNQEPQVLMRGGNLRSLVIYRDMVAPGNGISTQHDIRMTEHGWRYFNAVSQEVVSRSDFLSVLGAVQYVLIKASYGSQLQLSRIADITMEMAQSMERGVEPGLSGGVARMIELCVCPIGYTGLSCQVESAYYHSNRLLYVTDLSVSQLCAPGFFRLSVSELSRSQRTSVVVSPCVRCRCNNHSEVCNAETGDCEQCQHQTTGRRCELCAAGHYGKVRGSITDCSMCACPLLDNSFSHMCVSDGVLGDYVCTSCQRGYEGRYCERCSDGHYGTPSVLGGACFPCGCSGRGSKQQVCDSLSGQCECNPGVKGRTCDQCEERHVLQGEQCVSCDDECTGVLLGELDVLSDLFMSVNLTHVSIASYRHLLMLHNHTRDVQEEFSKEQSSMFDLWKAEDDLDHVTSDITTLLEQMSRLSDVMLEVGVSTNNTITQSALLLKHISYLQYQTQELQREAGLLNQTTEEELHPTNEAHLLEEVESVLQKMRLVNIAPTREVANQERSLAQDLVSSIQEEFFSGRVELDDRLRPLRTSMTVTMEMLREADEHVNKAAQHNIESHTVLNNSHTLLQQHQSQCVSVRGLLEHSQLMLADALDWMEDLTNSSVLQVLWAQLEQWRPLLKKKVEAVVVGLKGTDALHKVYQAEGHAHQVESHANSLHRSLSSVWNTSHTSSGLAHHDGDITQRVSSANQAASAAFDSASMALSSAIQSEQLVSQVGGASLTVLGKSSQIQEEAEGLCWNVSTVTSRLRLVKHGLHNSSLLFHEPIRALQSLSNGSTLQEAELQVTAARFKLQEVLLRLQVLRKQVDDSSSVVEDSSSSSRLTNQMLTHTHSTANEVQQKLEEAELRTQHLIDRMKPLRILGETINRNLSDIRELITQTRRQAASIKVAMAADRKCIRSYRPQVESSHFNTLSLILKTTSRENLLFYLSSNTTVDYLAVQVKEGRVSLMWDLGSGQTQLDFPHIDVTNNQWTHINATRFGRRGYLSVHQLDSGVPLLPAVTASSPGSSRVLDIDNNTMIHIGGLGAHTRTPAGLSSTSFHGCLGEASLNERNIGLWNYEHTHGECRGCYSSPQGEGTSFHFDGSGFSLVQKSLRSTSTSIIFLFKTLSPGGLLLYLSSNNTKDFLSMELVEGRVRLNFDLGSGSLVLTSTRKYNTGLWFKVTLQRNRRKGYLSIMAADQSAEKEVLEAESPGSSSDLNRSDLDPIYIGGLPASRLIRRQMVSRSYVGCIKNVEIARSNFDLLRDAYGVRKGCVLEAVRSVSIMHGGFLEVAPPSFAQEAEFLFSFSSINQSGVLLAMFSDGHSHKQNFLSIHLLSGVLEAELGEMGGVSRTVAVMKRDGETLSDGSKHSVIVTINRKFLTLQVDEGHIKSVSLLPGGFSRHAPASFFIGGLPPAQSSHLPMRLQDLYYSFIGCIQHLVLGGVLVDLSGAVRYEGVELDSCHLVQTSEGAELRDEQNVEPTPHPIHLTVAPPTHLNSQSLGSQTCALVVEPTFVASAAQFGSLHSHMTFIINPSTVRKSVSLTVSLRTRSDQSLVVLLSDSKLMDFVLVRLKRGRVLVSADLGKGPASVSSPVPVNDGHWHTVSAEVSRRSVSVSVDGSDLSSASLKGNQLDVNNLVYLGGAPPTLNTRRINVSSSLQGCIRSLTINRAILDLTTPTSQHDVTSCFAKEETGSYFNGSGYAELVHRGYKVGSDLSVSLEFRSSQSEGVLLGISSAKVDAIGLELIGGQVVFNVNNGAGRVSVRSIGQLLCDGQWHRLSANKSKHRLSLSVDGRSFTTTNPYPQSTSAETNNPVYLGGFPVGVKQNCLSLSVGLKGCMKNVRLIKSNFIDPLNLSSAHLLLGVQPESCPVA